RPDDRGALEEALEALDGAEDADALERIAAVALRDHHERLAAAEGVLHGAVAPVVLGPGGQDARRRARIADLHARQEHDGHGEHGAAAAERHPAAARPEDAVGQPVERPREPARQRRSEEHTSELQSRFDLVCRLLLEKKNERTSARTASWVAA